MKGEDDAESFVELSTLTESGTVKEPTPLVFIEGLSGSIKHDALVADNVQDGLQALPPASFAGSMTF